MSTRFTVVLDDELYRETKVRAASDGVALKELVEGALRAYLAGEPAVPRPRFSWEKWDRWQDEAEALDVELGPGPDDLSDIKYHLYGYPKAGAERGLTLKLAEEPAPYNANQR